MKKGFLISYFILVFLNPSGGSSVYSDSTIVIFPEVRLFPSLFLDPLECQTNGSSTLLLRKNENNSLYSLVNLGFTKPVIVINGKSFAWEVNFGAATFTQFDLIRRDDGSYLAGLLNNDYKVSADLSVVKENQIFRIRLFHVSSHMGDDYLMRHGDLQPNDKSVNYEQIDMTYLRSFENGFGYFGAGEIYTPYVFRKRLSFQTGGLLNFRKRERSNLFAGTDIKLLAENEFTPDIRSALGICLNRKGVPIFRLWIDYYAGQLPYSTIDYGRVNWVGLGMNIKMF